MARSLWSTSKTMEMPMSNWFYVAGSLCFLVGTIINMVKR